MDRGNDFLKAQIHGAVLQHKAFLRALEDHEAQTEDARFRDLCTRYIATMRDHQRMLEDYQSELGPPARGTLKRVAEVTMGAARELADSATESDFHRLARDSVLSSRAEDSFRTFRDAGRVLGLRHLAQIGETGEREHDAYKRDANRLAQQMFVERARDQGARGTATQVRDLSP